MSGLISMTGVWAFHKTITLAVAAVLIMLHSTRADAAELVGTAGIVDGDTLVIQGASVRLFGIDAAETGQRCVNSQRKIVRPSDDAIARMESMAQGVMRCKGSEYDDYGRLIATCISQAGEEINRTLVKEGLAWRIGQDFLGGRSDQNPNSDGFLVVSL